MEAGEPGWRRNFLVLWLAQVVAMAGFSSAVPFIPLYLQELGVRGQDEVIVWSGGLSAAAAISMAVMAPIWGTLADRYGRKPMVTRSMIGGGAIVALMALATDVRQLLALRTLQGAFSGTVAASRVLVAAIVPSRQLGQSLGLMATAAFIGSSVGPLLGGVVADAYGFRAAFLVTGLLLSGAGVAVVLLIEERFRRPAPGARSAGRGGNLRLLVELPQIRAVIVALFAVQVGQMAISPLLPLFVQELTGGTGATGSITGLVLGVTAVTSAAAASLGGRLGDRIGHQRVLALAAIVSGLLYVPVALVQSPWQLVVLRGLVGLCVGGLMPVGMAMIGLLAPPDNRGWVFGLTATATALGNAVGPLLGSGVAAWFGLRAAFLLTAVALTAAGIWIAMMVRTAPAEPRTGGVA